MEACSEAGIPLVVLDRPNPNGFYIDGPVLDTALRSFVGMHPVPVVYGMTIGEYALMVNGEGWLGKGMKCNLKVVPMDGYDRNAIYRLPVRPSPNLPNWQAIYLYPSLCFLEGTIVSVGRGTDHPFQLIGHPAMSPADNFSFIPRPVPGASIRPPFEGQICNGKLLITYAEGFAERENHLSLSFLIESYKTLSPTHVFFTGYFDLLAGNAILKEQISKGLTESEIRATWKEGLESFKAIRKQYLCYPDI
jgi:uncharacterized protein YbbC (DUF1343 family)